VIHVDDNEDADWAAYALLVGKALSCARDSDLAGDLGETGARFCLHAAIHIRSKEKAWPLLTIVLYKERINGREENILPAMSTGSGKPN